MKKFLIIKYLLVIFISDYFCQSTDDSVMVFLAKDNWHTGIILQINEFTVENLPVLKHFDSYKYVDIGWGDEDFYQTPGFDLYYAAKAILVPSSSVIRIGGYNFNIEQIINWRDYAIKFIITKNQLLEMLKFINNSLLLNQNNEHIAINNEEPSSVIFFKSTLKYHALRTCNTWAAEAFKATGMNIRTFGLVTADQLFNRLKNFGEVIKKEN